jgi:transposase InsO family protein
VWLQVMRERGLLVRSRRLRARRKKEWGRMETSEPNQNLALGHDQDLGGANGTLDVSGLLHAGDRGLESFASLSVEADCDRTAACGQLRGNLTQTTDNGTQFTSSRLFETLARLGITIGGRRIITRKATTTLITFQ